MKTTHLFLLLTLTCTVTALAVTPPPDGGYPNQNTAEGEDALLSLTTGADNTAVGFHALHNITDSSGNTAIGSSALENSTAGPNTAIGYSALIANTTGFDNTAVSGLFANTTGHDNTAVGFSSMAYNTTGSFNTAMGTGSYGGNGSNNVAIGSDAMLGGAGSNNVAVGVNALLAGSGDNNVAIGQGALLSSGGSGNIAIGYTAGGTLGSSASNNIYIGNGGVDRDNGQIRIGTRNVQTAAFIAGISGVTVADGVDVVVNTAGQLGTITSSARYKESIQPMADESNAILSLQPVTFHYKKALDPAAIPQFGLVAEEVEKVAPELVVRDDEGKPYSVRYQAVNAMLLSEFQKEHRKAEERAVTIKAQQERIGQLEAAVTRLESRFGRDRGKRNATSESGAHKELTARWAKTN
jgi:Chaperone of endosialidase